MAPEGLIGLLPAFSELRAQPCGARGCPRRRGSFPRRITAAACLRPGEHVADWIVGVTPHGCPWDHVRAPKIHETLLGTGCEITAPRRGCL